MKSLVAVFSMFVFVGCSQGSSGGNGPTSDYASCESLPSGSPVDQNICPGAVGTWNNYEIKENSSGVVTSFKVWCSGTDEDHPENQADYDGYMVPGGSTSNSDFKLGSDCASGSSEDGALNRTVNIWQKVK